MPSIGVPELIIILVVVLIIFGPSRLKEIGGSLGKGIKAFKEEMKDEGRKEEKKDGKT